jgi:hypothetical protein
LIAVRTIDCEGAPRDLGLDQGRGCRAAIQADASALGHRPGLRAWAGSLLAGGAGQTRRAALERDLERHFPHLAERSAGIASGAGLSMDALVALLARELLDPERAALEAVAFASSELPVLALRVRRPDPPTGLVVRRVAPDGGYANLTIGRPGLGAALAGVNERGLAAAALPLGAPAPAERCQAPAALLAEGCLERLDTVEKALEWCERRPGGGRVRLVFADASGARGALEIDGAKRCRLGLGDLGRVRSEVAFDAHVDPAARSLSIERPGAPLERFVLAGGS